MQKSYLKNRWRLIQTRPAPGAWNMALDEALLESAVAGQSVPILRLYAWEPPCLSLGFAQPSADVDPQALEEHAWHLVRRPTGGRAILHTDELTYSVIGSQRDPRLAGSVLESYQKISAALLAALHLMGLPAQSDPGKVILPGTDPKGPVCFEVPSNYEITLHGRKLIGSAQARRKDCILQHGSLPLHGDLTRITQVLFFKGSQDQAAARSMAGQRLVQHATTVEVESGRLIPWESAAQSFTQAFTDEMNLEFNPETPGAEELARAAVLMETKYAQDSWTRRV